MDCFQEPYLILFGRVTKVIESLEKLSDKELPFEYRLLLQKEIDNLKYAQILAEEEFISQN